MSVYNIQGAGLSSKEDNGANTKKFKVTSSISYVLMPKQYKTKNEAEQIKTTTYCISRYFFEFLNFILFIFYTAGSY